MPSIVQVLVLAIVQGIAEFLPISSSGHLVIIGNWLGEIAEEPTLEILLHAGTLGSILVVFWKKILDLLRRDRRVIGLLVVGTIPAAVVGLIVKSQFTHLLRSPVLAGSMLLVTAMMLWLLGWLARRDAVVSSHSTLRSDSVGTSPELPVSDPALPPDAGMVKTEPSTLAAYGSPAPYEREAVEANDNGSHRTSDLPSQGNINGGAYQALSYSSVLVIGLFQAFAILPGISRSGSTILGGRLMGLRRDDALTMSFLLAIPAIGGASVLAMKDLVESVQSGHEMTHSIVELVLGTVLAFVVGIVALRWLIRWNQADRLSWFAWWCVPMGLLVLAVQYLAV